MNWKEALTLATVSGGWCNVTNAEYRPGGYKHHPNAGKIAYCARTHFYEVQNLATAIEHKGLTESDVPQALRNLEINDSSWS